jgi:hypothetical protein
VSQRGMAAPLGDRQDLPDTLDPGRKALVALGLCRVIEDLAGTG